MRSGTIIVTGKHGFVGKPLCKALESMGHAIFPQTPERLDFCDRKLVMALPASETIIHLASKSYVPDAFLQPADFYYNNVVSMINVLEKARVDKSYVIFLSTYVYGRPECLPIREDHPLNPLNPYTQSKIVCEELCKAYARDFGVSVTILRPFNIYGPGQSSKFFIPTILRQLGNPVIELQDPAPRRDFIHVDDVISAIIQAVDRQCEGVGIYNIGSGVSYSIKEVVSMIIRCTRSAAQVKFTGISRKGEVLETRADIRKAERELNWRPLVSFEAGISGIARVHQLNQGVYRPHHQAFTAMQTLYARKPA